MTFSKEACSLPGLGTSSLTSAHYEKGRNTAKSVNSGQSIRVLEQPMTQKLIIA